MHIFAYVGREESNIDNKLPVLIHDFDEARSSPESSGDENVDRERSFSLHPGERRGWWSGAAATAGKVNVALVSGAVCDCRTRILLDSGASTSILSLRLAQELGLKLSFGQQLKVKGLGDVMSKVTARAHVKITLGISVVYYMDIWCGNIGEGLDCLLGMDFLVAAGVRLSAGDGTVRLPDEESIPLLAPGPRPRLPEQVTIVNSEDLYIPVGSAVLIPRTAATTRPDLEIWMCRGRTWVTSLLPGGVQVVNVSDGDVFVPLRTSLAYLVEQGHLPDGQKCVRPSSPKYREWQLAIYEHLRSPEQERARLAEVERYNSSLPPAVERPVYAHPTKILSRGNAPAARALVADADNNVAADAGSSVEVGFPMTMQLLVGEQSPAESTQGTQRDVAAQLATCYRAMTEMGAHRAPESGLGQPVLDAAVYYHEGTDHILLESLRDQLAMLPEVATSAEPVDIETADVGEPENTPEEIAQMRAILRKHQSAFISSGNALPPPARGVVCDIEVEPGTKPIAQKMRRIPADQLAKVAELLKNLLEAGIIEYSESPWASPIVIVMKKNGKDIRLCIDYRRVNQLINLMNYPLPLIDELLENFDSIMWFLSLDMASGFWAIQMTLRARLISAFLCPLGHFQWVRMPFGLKNAPLIYQRAIDNALWGFVRLPPALEAEVEPEVLAGVGLPAPESGVDSSEPAVSGGPSSRSEEKPVEKTVFDLNIPAPACMGPVLGRSSYIDDIAHGARTWEGSCEAADRLLYRLRYWRISVSLPKSAFGKKSIDYLSHEINRFGIRALPKILKGIDGLEFPTSLKGVQSFLGSLNYYHKFIEGFPAIATVLYELTDERIRAGRDLEKAKQAFEMLKLRVQNLPELRHADKSKPFTIILHANAWAVGAVLAQEHEGVLWPVKFVGRTLQDAELRYSDAEKEILALLRVLNSCYTTIVGRPLVIYTRHSVLKWIMTSKSLTERLAKWATFLSPWTFEVQKVTKDLDGLAALYTAGITPREHIDEAVSGLVPEKAIRAAPVISLEMLEANFEGYVVSFDGAAKLKSKCASASFVLWKLPGWKIIHAQGLYREDLTVNEAEYHGLLSGMDYVARREDLGIEELVVVGDSRIAIQQCQGLIGCNQLNLQMLLSKFEASKKRFKSVKLVHVKREFNAAADHMSTKALRAGCDEQASEEEVEQLEKLNTLASKMTVTTEAGVEEGLVEDQAEVLTVQTRGQSTAVGSPFGPADLIAGERWRRIRQHQLLDPVLGPVMAYLEGNLGDIEQPVLSRVAKMADTMVLDERSILRYVGGGPKERERLEGRSPRLVVPATLREDVMHLHHEDVQGGHQGIMRTFQKLRAEYYWPGMYLDTARYVQDCTDCATSKGQPPAPGPSPGNVEAEYPMHILAMDLIIPLPRTKRGHVALCVFVCLFTGIVMGGAMRGTTAQDVAELYMSKVFCRYGASSIIRHDRDPRFMSEVFKHFSLMMGSKQRATLAYRPQANGQAERAIQTLTRTIKAYVEDPEQDDWDELAEKLLFAINTSYDSTRRETPFFLGHGWDAKTTMSAMLAPVPTRGRDKLQAYAWRIKHQRQYEYAQAWARQLQRDAQQHRADKRNEAWENLADRFKMGFEVGDSVWLYLARVKPGLTKKLAHLWHGPFRIVEKAEGDDFRVRIKTEGTPYRVFPWIHVSRLKPRLLHPERPESQPEVEIPEDIDFDEALLPEDSWEPAPGHYEVEEIRDVRWHHLRGSRKRKEYLIKWAGYDEPTWEPREKLHCGRLLYEFDRGARSRARFAAMQTGDGDGEN